MQFIISTMTSVNYLDFVYLNRPTPILLHGNKQVLFSSRHTPWWAHRLALAPQKTPGPSLAGLQELDLSGSESGPQTIG